MKHKDIILGEEVYDTNTKIVGKLVCVENNFATILVSKNRHQFIPLDNLEYTSELVYLKKLFTNKNIKSFVKPKNYKCYVSLMSKKWAEANAKEITLSDFFQKFREVFPEETQKYWERKIQTNP